jgi:hypothetical protein
MRIVAMAGAMAMALMGTAPAGAQSDFESEVLRRLERLERRIDELERGGARQSSNRRPFFAPPPAREETIAAVSLLCGANCGMAAQFYCKNTGFANGVPVQIEKRNGFDHVTRARCFN